MIVLYKIRDVKPLNDLTKYFKIKNLTLPEKFNYLPKQVNVWVKLLL